MIAHAKTVEEIVGLVSREILTPFVAILFVLAAIIFFWGIIEFLWSGDSEEAKTVGKRHMLWGLVGLGIMTAVNAITWVLINFVAQIR
jgi:hypothetical protein